jgi:hypothetical protein
LGKLGYMLYWELGFYMLMPFRVLMVEMNVRER